MFGPGDLDPVSVQQGRQRLLVKAGTGVAACYYFNSYV
jgi:hypothetical protein